MKKAYKYKNFHPKTYRIIQLANNIIKEYASQGYELTLRQLYYQFVARDLLPNTQESYNKLGNIISDARLCGLIDWTAIVDRTRNLRSLAHWNDPQEILHSASHSFRFDKWENQEYYIECWIEKDALIGIIAQTCNRLDIPYFSCRGYTSQSEIWSCSQRIISKDKPCIILHLGDHDPSGLDMTRDIKDRLEIFEAYNVEVERIALNMDQVEEHKPPPNPAKMTDTRFKNYVNKFGLESWELDALEPNVIDKLITMHILYYLDEDIWNKDLEIEREEKDNLTKLANNFFECVDFVRNKNH